MSRVPARGWHGRGLTPRARRYAYAQLFAHRIWARTFNGDPLWCALRPARAARRPRSPARSREAGAEFTDALLRHGGEMDPREAVRRCLGGALDVVEEGRGYVHDLQQRDLGWKQ